MTTVFDLTQVKCYTCNTPIYMHAQTLADLKQSQRTFTCLYGHKQGFYGNRGSPADKIAALERDVAKAKQNEARLHEEIDAAKKATARASARAEQNLRSARAFKGAATRIRTRVAGGVCPCCNRTFAALTEHMKKQHPDYPRAPLVKKGDEAHG